MRRSTIPILLTLPTAAHASGSEVLGLLWAQAGLFLLVAASLFVVRLSSTQKTVVFVAYLASAIVANYAVLDIPYLENALLVNGVTISVPLLVWIVVLGYLIRRRGKKHYQPLHPAGRSGASRRPSAE